MDKDPLIGKSLGRGKYLIQAKIGEGGMAQVYKAYHTSLRREVAIKVISAEIAHLPDFKVRFEREAQLVANLEHSNIVIIYDFVVDDPVDQLTYLVMQYVGGGTLRDHLRAERPMDPRQAANYALQMANALHSAHRSGIVHRDVKPQNMLISTNDPNTLLLSDFGIAKLFDTSQEVTSQFLTGGPTAANPLMTSATDIVGTAAYMAPEQALRKSVDARTDVYALGLVLYQMLTGKLPFEAPHPSALIFKQVYEQPRPIRELNPAVPEILAMLTAKALEKAPEARFQSAQEMAQVLEAYVTPSTNLLSSGALQNLFSGPMQGGVPSISLSQGGYSTPLPSHYSNALQSGAGHPYQPNYAVSQPGISEVQAPPKRKRRSKLIANISTVAIVLVAIFSLVLTASRLELLPDFMGNSNSGSGGGSTAPPGAAAAFTETFTDEELGWLIGNEGNLNAVLSGNQYSLTTSDDKSYFPHPSKVGTLPEKFTLIANIAQSEGPITVLYGLAFHLNYTGDQVQSGYAFVVNVEGKCAVLFYEQTNGVTQGKVKWQGDAPTFKKGLGETNELQVEAKNGVFSFTINGSTIQIAPDQTEYTPNPAAKGGRLALMVSGPKSTQTEKQAKFIVTRVALTV